MGQATMNFGLQVIAEGEVRNAQGDVVDRPRGDHTEVVQVNLVELREAVERRGLSDDQLRAIGLDDNTIAKIRSAS